MQSMRLENFFTSMRHCLFVLLFSLMRCTDENEIKENINCGYGGETILELKNEPVLIREVDEQFFFWVESGLELNSEYLMDTIYLLKPCNLSSDFQTHGQYVLVSGKVMDNPPYSSHSNYTDFFIEDIKRIYIR